MGTRAYVIIKVKEADKGRSLSFDTKKLDAGMKLLDDQKFEKGPDGCYCHGLLTDDIFRTTEKVFANYLAIYVQSDGYPTGLGACLLEHFNSHEKAMNLLAAGTAEAIYDEKMIYCEPRRRSLEEDGYGNAFTPIQCANPTPCESWQYLFYEGRWYCRQYGSRWYNLEELLNKKGENADADLPDMKAYKSIPSWYKYPEAHDKAYNEFKQIWNNMLPVGRGLVHLRVNS